MATTTTSSDYKLYALPGDRPIDPGWCMWRPANQEAPSKSRFGKCLPVNSGALSRIPVPLGIGTVTLVSGEAVQGFLCEHYATALAADISHMAVGEPTSSSWRRTDPQR